MAPHLVEGEDAAARQAKLAKAVSKEIIPRLMDLHHEVLPPGVHPTEEEISDLAHLVLGPDNYAAIEFVRSLRARAPSPWRCCSSNCSNRRPGTWG